MLHNNAIEIPDWIKERTNSELILSAIDNGINLVTSTSMGRLFDAVSALLDICHYNSYEGQAPIELENIAALADELETEGDECFSFSLGEDGDTKALLRDIVNTIIANRSSIIKESDSDEESTKELKGKIARGFIDAIADYVYTICKREKINQIVLSGGTFLNRILLEKTIDKLEAEGFKVYISEQLPPGDGGICLGQAYLHGQMSED
jgi:hydrogenase maturation protein HypF